MGALGNGAAGGASPYRYVGVELEGPVAYLTMKRPEKRNALSLDHMKELTAALEQLGETREARAIVIRGEGPSFCSGHDLNEMVGASPRFLRELFSVCVRMMETIQAVPQPVIAQVHGVATAAGCQLVAACDLAVAAETARFATPGVRIGLFCSTPMVALSRAIGRKKALEMLLTGEPLSAQEALQHGLVNKVVPEEALEAETRALAERIAAASPFTVAIGKQAFYRQIDLPQDQAYAYTREIMTLNALAYDAQEGMGAFLQKRQPQWKGE